MLISHFIKRVFVSIFFITAIAGGASAGGDIQEPSNVSNGWKYQIAPYAFIPGMYGDMTIAGNKVDVDLSPADFIDVIKESDSFFVLTAYMEARKGPIAFYLDVMYADLTLSSGDISFTAGPINGTAALRLDYTTAVIEGGVSREIWNSGSYFEGSYTPRTTLDAYLGLRWWYQDAKLALSLAGPGPGRTANVSDGSNWFDPLIGLKFKHQIASNKALSFKGDIGGFGVGSDFSWQLAGIYSYDFGEKNGVTWSGLLGYRAISSDYSDDDFGYNITQHGPVLGLSAKW